MLLGQVALAGAHPNLRLQPEVTRNYALGAGASLDLALTLVPTAELDLEGGRLAIDVDAVAGELQLT